MFAKSTVYHVVKTFKKLDASEDRSRSESPHSARPSTMIKSVQERVRRNRKRSARQIAKDMNVSVTLMRRIIKNDLKLLPTR